MKYVLNNLLKCFFTVSFILAAVSCGDDGPKKIVIKNKDGEKITSYQEACTMHDFETAHRFVAKMPESGYPSWDVSSAKEHVFREEALFLIAQGDEASKKRIMFLLKQDPERNDYYLNILVELAISQNDEDFVKTLTRQYKSEIQYSVLRKIVEFLYIEKGNEHVTFLTTLLNRYDQLPVLLTAATENNDENLVLSLASSYKKTISLDTFKSVIELLRANKSVHCNTIFNQLMSNVTEIDGLIEYAKEIGIRVDDLVEKHLRTKLNELKNNNIIPLKKGHHGSSFSERDAADNNIEISTHNNECINLLTEAIDYKNRNVAQDVINIMKPNVYGYANTSMGVDDVLVVDGVKIRCHRGYVKHVNDDINRAKQIYNDAVRRGAFNR